MASPRTAAEPRVLGVIPARGGSKRLKRKNIRLVGGEPLIVHTIRAAQQALSLTDFLVSSEDEEILEIARDHGAPTPFVRPACLATDEVRNIDTVLHALDFMEQRSGRRYDMVVLLQPTCPVRKPEHIDGAVRLLWKSKLPTLASVKGPYKKRDPNLKSIRNDTLVDYCELRHDMEWEPFYIYNAAIYAAKRSYLVEERRLVSDKQVPFVMDELHSVDVDSEIDLMVAELFLEYRDRYLAAKE